MSGNNLEVYILICVGIVYKLYICISVKMSIDLCFHVTCTYM